MILFVAVALAATSVPLAGGSLSRLRLLRLRDRGLVVAALAVQVLIISVIPASLPAAAAQGLELASYALVVAFILRNRHIEGLWLVALGGMCNLAAIGANQGVMPARQGALVEAGRAGVKHGFANSAHLTHPHLQVLGDIFAIPRGWPLANVFSIGDVTLVVGAVLLLHCAGDSRLGRAWRRARHALVAALPGLRARDMAAAPAG